MGGQVGFDKMVTYARELGLGEKTGINYVNESPGKVPLFKSGYAVNHMSSHGDDFEVTAIQLAALVSAMSNGGGSGWMNPMPGSFPGLEDECPAGSEDRGP